MTASHVCKSFAANAEIAFGQKYLDEWYCTGGDEDYEFHRNIINKYGGKISKLSAAGFEYNENDENELIFDVIQQKCSNLKSISLFGLPDIVYFNGLKEINLDGIENMSEVKLETLFENNEQLEKLELTLNDGQTFHLDVLHNRLPMLKCLKIEESSHERCFFINIPRLTLPSLESLEINDIAYDDYEHILRALDCNELRNLRLEVYGDVADVDDNFITQICKFKMLTTFRTGQYTVTMDHMRLLAEHLPNLIELETKITESESNEEAETKIFTILTLFRRLKKLTVLAPDFQ